MHVLVYLNDSVTIGPFGTKAEAETWVSRLPNVLFQTQEQLDHATGNGDWFVTELVSPAEPPPDWFLDTGPACPTTPGC